MAKTAEEKAAAKARKAEEKAQAKADKANKGKSDVEPVAVAVVPDENFLDEGFCVRAKTRIGTVLSDLMQSCNACEARHDMQKEIKKLLKSLG